MLEAAEVKKKNPQKNFAGAPPSHERKSSYGVNSEEMRLTGVRIKDTQLLLSSSNKDKSDFLKMQSNGNSHNNSNVEDNHFKNISGHNVQQPNEQSQLSSDKEILVPTA